MKTIIKLTPYEMLFAAQVGIRRNIESQLRGDRHLAGPPPDGVGWNNDIEGACGEMAVAKAFGVYWEPSVNTYLDGGDVGNWQVRTRSKDYYELFIRPRDVEKKPDKPFILVIGKAPNFRIVGWIICKDAVRDEWRQSYGGMPAAWFVPQAHLRPIDDLFD